MSIVKPVSLLTGGSSAILTSSWRTNSIALNDWQGVEVERAIGTPSYGSLSSRFAQEYSTYEMWVAPHEALDAVSIVQYLGCVGLGNSGWASWAFRRRWLDADHPSIIDFAWWENNASRASAGNWPDVDIPLNAWTHLAMRVFVSAGSDVVDQIGLAVNGVDVGPPTVAADDDYSNIFDGAVGVPGGYAPAIVTPLHIGISGQNVLPYHQDRACDSSFSNVRYWGELRSIPEIADNMYTTTPDDPRGELEVNLALDGDLTNTGSWGGVVRECGDCPADGRSVFGKNSAFVPGFVPF